METITKQFDLLIDGKIISSESRAYFDSINPSSGEVFAQIADAATADMKVAIASAKKAFESKVWSQMAPSERGIYLKKIAKAIRSQAKELAECESLDTGKTIKQTTFIDVPTCADAFDYFSNIDEKTFQQEIPVAAPAESSVVYEPFGVVGLIIPWNYPLIMAAWKLATALMAGNCVILKPSPLGCASVMMLAQIIKDSGIPDGVVNVVSSSDDNVSSELVASSDVDMISFTGSTETGKKILTTAASTVKKVSCELGGKSASIVFADCDFEAALGGTLSSIFMNQGQMCTAMSRVLIEDGIYDKFVAELVQRTKQLKIGDAIDYQTQFGPVISKEQLQRLEQFVELGVSEGATLACGGKEFPAPNPGSSGFYFEPTILTNVVNSMNVARQEAFGPVLCIMRFSTAQEAVNIANDSDYGLAASIWTKDEAKARECAGQLQCGTVWINTYGGFYNEVAFGGYKQSGTGRELGIEGLREYLQTKHVCIDKTPGGTPLVSGWF